MKNKYLLLIACGLITLSQIDCKKITNKITIYISANYIKYSTTLKVYDPGDTTGTPISGVTMTLSGQDAANIYEIAGKKVFTVQDGNITLGVDPKFNPSVGVPVIFTATFSATGYLPVNIPVTIANGQFKQKITVPMIKISNPPAGVTVVTHTPALTNNKTTAPDTLTTPLTNGKTQQIKVAIPAGTQFLNAAGTVLTGSTLNATVVHFDTKSIASVTSFPGGLNADKITNKSGTTGPGYFNTAGFATINMDVSGEAVKTFNQPISATIDVNPSTINPTTNALVKAGDIIPVYSYDNGAQAWQYEQDATIASIGGKLVATFSAHHLSTYEIGYEGTTCTSDATVTFNMSDTSWSDNYTLLVYSSDDTSNFIFSTSFNAKHGDVKYLHNIPATGRIQVLRWNGSSLTSNGYSLSFTTNASSNPVYSSSSNANLCGNTTINVTAPAASTRNPSITINIQAICSNSKTIIPSFEVEYKLSAGTTASNYASLGSVVDGTMTTTELKLGVYYDFRTYYNGETIEAKNQSTSTTVINTTVHISDPTICN